MTFYEYSKSILVWFVLLSLLAMQLSPKMVGNWRAIADNSYYEELKIGDGCEFIPPGE